MPRLRSRRGSALIMALLVILILTTIGVGLAYFTSGEDRLSGNTRMQKAGLYAAEAGLRAAEAAISAAGSTLDSSAKINAALLPSATTVVATSPDTGNPPAWIDPPGKGYRCRLLSLSGLTNPTLLAASMNDPRARLKFTVYVRNNADDFSTSTASSDLDQTINIVSIGEYISVDASGNQLVDASGKPISGIQKVIEEQVSLRSLGGLVGAQKGGNTGGTGGATY